MKTIANTMKALVASLIILASFSGIARAENAGKESIEAGTALQAAAYNAKNFVEAELATETECWMNGNDGTINNVAEPELALQGAAYKAKAFVEAELAAETESWVNNPVTVTKSEEGFNYGNKLANK